MYNKYLLFLISRGSGGGGGESLLDHQRKKRIARNELSAFLCVNAPKRQLVIIYAIMLKMKKR